MSEPSEHPLGESHAVPGGRGADTVMAPSRSRWLWPALLGTVVVVVLPLALVLAALAWMGQTPAGTAWLVDRLPGVTVTAPVGSLIGDFSAERVLIALPGAAAEDRIVIAGLRWRGLALARPASKGAWLRIEVQSLQADRVDVLIAPSAAGGPPGNLLSPIEIELGALDVAELHASTLGEHPLLGLHARLQLGADAGSLHRAEDLSFAWDRVAVRGRVQIASQAPLDVELALAIESRTDAAVQERFGASLTARGPLTRLALQATLRGTAAEGRGEAPSLDLEAAVMPFSAWPLGTLQLRTRALDLALLHSQAPGTSLTGTAEVQSTGLDLPAAVSITLGNARAGRVDEGLLPVRSINADLRASLHDPLKGEIRALDIALGTAREAGGRLQGQGRWTPGGAVLDARLSDVAPRVLDARAPLMNLSGSATLELDDGSASSPARPPSAVLRGRFSGKLPHNGRVEELALDLDATATAQRVELRKAQLQAGASRASLAGQALRQASGDWQVKAQGTLADFDPALWWPGREGSAWRKGPHRFNGTLALEGRLPRHDVAFTLQQLAQAQGQAVLQVTDSQLAGASLAGEITMQGAGSAGLQVGASLAVAGSSIALRGRLAPDAKDHWEVETRAADLSRWAPLLQLTGSPGQGVPRLTGLLDAEVRFDGRWPQLGSTGRVALKDAQAGALRLTRGSLRWTASTAPQAPLEVLAEIDQVGIGAQRLDSLHLRVEGSAADHRLVLDAAAPARPPKWLDLLHGADSAPGSGTLGELRAQGALQFDTAWVQPLRWQGRVQQARLRRGGAEAAPAPWIDVAESTFEAQYDPLSRTPRVTLGPGRAALPNLALRWSGLRWQGGSAPLLELQAEVEPYAVAPLLARLQPDFGWKGDLIVAGRVNVRSSPTFVAEVEIGRQGGDLTVTDETGVQALELTDLRLAVDARDGVWNFTQALAGKSLGALASAVTVRTDPKAFWPPADAPLQGVMELQIANLAAWGAWAPPGWRLKGAVHASASFGGRFEAPEYTGQVDGSGLGVRNLVEGIDLRDGELDIALQGETARIRRLRARAGDGSVELSGDAVFGATPQLQLRLVADRMLLLGRVDRRVVASGDARLQLRQGKLELDGKVNVDQGLIDVSRGSAPGLGDDVQVLRGPTPAVAAESALPGRGLIKSVAMNVALDLGRALRLRGHGLDTRLQGELLLSAPGGKLALNGSVDAAGGTYAAYNQKLQIERGTVTFSGTIDNARLDILAVRPNTDIVVGVAITGSTSRPRVSLYSDPDLPDNVKLSWLVLGRPPEETGGGDSALLQAAAMAILAGEGDGPASQLTRLNPLDTLSVRQTDGTVRDTVVTVGKQLSQRWYIGYERSLSETAGNWQLIYRVAQRFTVRLQTGLDNSIDLIWSWRWE